MDNTIHSVDLDTKARTTVRISQRSHLETVALGFLVLAGGSPFFKRWLKQRLLEKEFVSRGVIDFPEIDFEYERVAWLPPINPAVAESKLAWLLREIEYVPEYQRQRVVKTLAFACGNIIVPKAAEWGILWGETLNVLPRGQPDWDLGLDYSQPVILGMDWDSLKPQELTKLVSRVSLMTVARCIEDACLKLDRLEPEVSSWLLEGSGVRLYGAENGRDIQNILTQLRDSGLPFASISEEVDVLALQPCITGSYDTLLAGLKQLE